MKASTAAWTLAGTVIGAGFASGRELVSFFSRWNMGSYAALAAATGMLVWIALTVMQRTGIPPRWQGKWGERLWKGLFRALLLVTGGAMTAAAGEIAALTLPVHGAGWTGMALTLALALLMGRKGESGLRYVSLALTGCLTVMMIAGLRIPAMQAVAVEAMPGWKAIVNGTLHGLCYGGMNGALAVPVMQKVMADVPAHRKKAAVLAGCGILAVLLLMGNAVMLRHPALQGEGMPMIRLLSAMGQAGYALGTLALYLSALSTLLACLAGTREMKWMAPAMMAGIALMGFSAAVEKLYPLLGAGCMAILVWAEWEK